MTSKFLDPDRLAKQDRFEFDFPDGTLKDRVILAPGGAGGLGAATAALLAAEGALVVAGYRSNRARAERLAQTLSSRGPGKVICVESDIGQESGRRSLMETALAQTGEIYGLVNFVGDPARVKLEDLDETSLTDSLTANFVAPLLLARDAGLHMREKNVAGSIVFLSTMQAVEPFAGSVNYAAPKAALTHAARILAKEWGPQVRVNVVAPGVNAAGMALASIESGKYDRFVREGIIPRFGRPEDIARVVRLLLEPDNYLTGQVITVDGGLTLRRG